MAYRRGLVWVYGMMDRAIGYAMRNGLGLGIRHEGGMGNGDII